MHAAQCMQIEKHIKQSKQKNIANLFIYLKTWMQSLWCPPDCNAFYLSDIGLRILQTAVISRQQLAEYYLNRPKLFFGTIWRSLAFIF